MKTPALRIAVWILCGLALYFATTFYLKSTTPDAIAQRADRDAEPALSPVPAQSSENEVSQWTVSQDEIATLQSRFLFTPYEIHPLPGVSYVTFDKRNSSHIWIGADRPVGMSTHFAVSLVPLKADAAVPPVEVLQRSFVDAMQSRHKTWKEDPVEVGMVNGIKFRRVAWHGVTQSDFEMKGVLYSAIHNQHFIQILCRDIISENPDIVKQGDRVARTFRVVPVPAK